MADLIRIGDLRHKLRFETRTNAGNGLVSVTWQTAFTDWGAVSDVSGREFFTAAAQHMENITTFTIRARSGITTTMRIVFQSRPYEIVQINNMRYRGDFMQIKARWTGGEAV